MDVDSEMRPSLSAYRLPGPTCRAKAAALVGVNASETLLNGFESLDVFTYMRNQLEGFLALVGISGVTHDSLDRAACVVGCMALVAPGHASMRKAGLMWRSAGRSAICGLNLPLPFDHRLPAMSLTESDSSPTKAPI